MELTLNFGSVNKTFESGPIKFGFALKIIKLDEFIANRRRILVNGTDDEVAAELLKINEYKEFCEHAKLLVEFFDNQFTYEEFLEGYFCESLQAFNDIILQMIAECKFGITSGFGSGGEEKKQQTQTSKMI